MKIIVGLGNPGYQYRRSRHNTGFLILDFLLRLWGVLISADEKPISTDRIGVNQLINRCESALGWKQNKRTESTEALVRLTKGEVVVLAKPQTMMNASGRAVKKLLSFYKVGLGDLLVIHDDLDLKLGEFKLQLAKGPRVHHGVNSVEEALATGDFWRLRVGVDNRNPLRRTNGERYVLQDFAREEEAFLVRLLQEKIAPAVITWRGR